MILAKSAKITVRKVANAGAGVRYKIYFGSVPIGEADFGISRYEKTAYVSFFHIDESFRGRGYGKAAWSIIEQKLRADGAKKIYLIDVEEDAWGFWHRMGFQTELKRL